jgi:hypothetical protein
MEQLTAQKSLPNAQYPRTIAVLTGDIVGSTALGPEKLERAFDALKDCAEQLEGLIGAPLHFTRHRGDGWQVAIENPKYTLRAASAFRASLKALGKGFDSYIGVSKGYSQHPLTSDLNQHNSEAFQGSGKTLEDVKSSHGTLAVRMNAINDISINREESAAFIFADHLIQGWTPIQAQVMLHFLQDLGTSNYTKAALQLGKSRQAVTKSAEAAGLTPFTLALSHIESDQSHV